MTVDAKWTKEAVVRGCARTLETAYGESRLLSSAPAAAGVAVAPWASIAHRIPTGTGRVRALPRTYISVYHNRRERRSASVVVR